MTALRPACRLWCDAALAQGQAVGLAPDQSHYLRHVLRLTAGDGVALFNARDGEWAARIDGFGKGWVSLEVTEQRRRPAPEPDLWLLFAPIKRARIDFLAQKATELGASRLVPVLTRRTVMGRVNVERLAANAREAAEQCERLSVPEVSAAAPLPELLAAWPQARPLLVCAEAGDAEPIAEVAASLPASGAVALLVGPEGGFAPEEIAACRAVPQVRLIGLGPRILRAETAALAALAVIGAIAIDGRQRPPERSGAAAPVLDGEPD